MSRDTSASFNTAAESDTVYPAALVEINYGDSNVVYFWTGYGDLVYDSNTYVGTGDLGRISDISEIADVTAQGITLRLVGLPPAQLSAVLSDARQGRDVRVHLALFNSAGTLVDVAEDVFKGMMDVPTVRKSAVESEISISVESRLIELEKAKVRRYTDEDQKELYPNDEGLAFVAGLQDFEIKWGRS